jgi:transposase-like protein
VLATARPRRIEAITGVERRHKWLVQEKAAIAAESVAEGAVVSEVTRRHGLSPQQVFGWSLLRMLKVEYGKYQPSVFAYAT